MIAVNPRMRFQGPEFIPAGHMGRGVGVWPTHPKKAKRVRQVKKARAMWHATEHARRIHRARRNEGTPKGQDAAAILGALAPSVTTIATTAITGKRGGKKEAAYVPSTYVEEEPASLTPWIIGGIAVLGVVGGAIWFMNQPKAI